MQRYSPVLLLLFMLCPLPGAHAQDTLFLANFNAGPSPFTLNTTDVGSTAAGYNSWIVNSSYPGGTGTVTCLGFPFTFTVPNTPSQPAGIAGAPSSVYMHTLSAAAQSGGVTNCCFLAADGLCSNPENYFSKMSSDISTAGYDTVTLNFWWICQGGPGSYGELYYSTNGGSTWTLHPGQPQYNNSGSWQQKTITDPLWANQATLRFGFRFVNQVTSVAADPGFGVDDILITGKSGVVLPVAAFTVNDTAFCEETCLFFTDLSQNNPTAWQWTFEGAVPDTSTLQNPTQICYDDTGTFDVTLIVTNASGTDTIVYSNYITVYANPPTPIVTASTDTLCTIPFQTGYQWYFNSSILIPGAVNYCYIAIFPGTYSVSVTDSNGCSAISDPFVFTGLSDHESAAFQLFPNPATGMVSIQSNTPKIFLRIWLTDIAGRRVLELNPETEAFRKEIDLTGIAPGLYNVLLQHQDGITALPLVIGR